METPDPDCMSTGITTPGLASNHDDVVGIALSLEKAHGSVIVLDTGDWTRRAPIDRQDTGQDEVVAGSRTCDQKLARIFRRTSPTSSDSRASRPQVLPAYPREAPGMFSS